MGRSVAPATRDTQNAETTAANTTQADTIHGRPPFARSKAVAMIASDRGELAIVA
jgi:hypothetical protein